MLILGCNSMQKIQSDAQPLHRGNNFDLVRLFAALLVLFSHGYPLAGLTYEPLASLTRFNSLGGLGVIIFFGVSGYLVTDSLKRSNSILHFIKNRVLRIYPALIVLTLLTVFVLGPTFTSLSLSDYFSNPVTHQYIHNVSGFEIAFVLPGVFENNMYKNAVNGSLWTIPLELQCYVVLVAIGLVPIRFEYKITAVFLAILFSIFYFRYSGVDIPPPLTKFDVQIRYIQAQSFYSFALGALYATWKDKFDLNLFSTTFVLFSIGLLFMNYMPYIGKFFIYTALFAFVMWVSLKPKLPGIPKKLGDISYGVYLYAFPVQQILAHYKIYEYGFWFYTGACAVVTILLAMLSWNLVEKRALRLKHKQLFYRA
jgi:peptidoglycan/LPS O-acetylase OafA/YrhL